MVKKDRRKRCGCKVIKRSKNYKPKYKTAWRDYGFRNVYLFHEAKEYGRISTKTKKFKYWRRKGAL